MYEIVYSDKEKAKVQKLKSSNKNLRKDGKNFEVVYYLVDGTDLVSGKKIASPGKTSVAEFIKSQKP